MSRLGYFLPLVLGLALGLALGLVYAWLIDPVQLYNTTPPLLRSDYRHEWIRLAALGYVADGDMDRALIRLRGLSKKDIQDALAAMIEAYAAHGQPAPTMRRLSLLARRLGVDTPAMGIYLETPAPPVGAVLPTPMPTSPVPPALPTPLTPTPAVPPFFSPVATPAPSPYRVIAQHLVCEGAPGQLRVWVQAAPPLEPTATPAPRRPTPTPMGPQPLPGVVLWLLWADGADRAVTGLRPWVSPGYADFTLQPGVFYALSVEEPNAPVLSGLTLQPCPDGERMGSWEIVLEK
ncbi:MAG: hypothetical protein RML46_05155 [Anaerolineae bacterium]|nr:hypothetical protein [Anaerolineae bacterium]MDW8068282.1 hypothetical protein [Anaerolineae bacterium]